LNVKILPNSQEFQTADLIGGSFFCLPKQPKQSNTKTKSKDYYRLRNSNMNHGNVLSDCCVLVLVQLEGKVKAVGTCTYKKSAYRKLTEQQHELWQIGNVRCAHCSLLYFFIGVSLLLSTHEQETVHECLINRKIHAGRRIIKIEIKFHT
jgi:hypothetical protein